MQANVAAADQFNQLYDFAGRNRQRVLLTALASRHGRPSLPALPQVCGVETQDELVQVVADLGATCARLGYSPNDFVILESGRLRPGRLTKRAFPT
jgi:hypothetical protein